MRREQGPNFPEATIKRLARDGVVTSRAMHAAGLSAGVVQRRVETGFLVRVARGVFILAGAQLKGKTAMRAALAISPGGAISLWSALHLHGLTKSESPVVHFTTPHRGHQKDHKWCVPHATRRLDLRDITTRDGILVTTVARTIRDLVEHLPDKPWDDKQITRLIEEALLQKKTTVAKLEAYANAEPSLILRRRLLRLLARQRGEPQLLKSKGEIWLRDFVENRGLPMPEFNVMVEGYEVDALWRKQRVIAEFDGFGIHKQRTKFDRDRLRDRRLLLAGWHTTRITETDFDDPPVLENDLLSLLALPPLPQHPDQRAS